MNINSFTSEVVSSPSALRVSDRKKNIPVIDKTFFKKSYKSKISAVSSAGASKTLLANCQPDSQNQPEFFDAINCLFPSMQPDRRQAKAIQTYRAKKLKQMFGSEGALQEAVIKHRSTGLNILSLVQNFKKTAPNGKALYAASRIRDPMGRFNGGLLTKPHSSEPSTVDQRDDGLIETRTIEGSFLSLLSLDIPAVSSQKQSALCFDFDTLYENRPQDHRRTLSVAPVSLPKNGQSACQSRKNELRSSARSVENELHTAETHQGYEEKPFWEEVEGLEDPLSYSHFPHEIFGEQLDNDLVSMEDLFANSNILDD